MPRFYLGVLAAATLWSPVLPPLPPVQAEATYNPDDPLPSGAAGSSVAISGSARAITPGKAVSLNPSTAVALTGKSVSLEAAKAVVRETEKEIAFELRSDALFDFDKAEIRRDAEKELREVAASLRSFRPEAIRLDGHTDSKGADGYNRDLSQRRAEAVRSWLVKKERFDSSRFEVSGLGESRPRAPNEKPDGTDWPEGRALNRRVEISARKG